VIAFSLPAFANVMSIWGPLSFVLCPLSVVKAVGKASSASIDLMGFLNRNPEKKCWVNYIVSDRRSANKNTAIACRGKKDRTYAAPLSV
jgi:hypothetical protein